MSGVNPQYQILERDKGRNLQSAWSTLWADVARFERVAGEMLAELGYSGDSA